MEQTRVLIGEPVVLGWLEGFVFGGTLFAYNVIRHGALPNVFAWAFGTVALACFTHLPTETKGAAVVPFMAWAFYYGRLGAAGLRSVPLLKPLTVALSWAWVTVVLPLSSEAWPLAGALFVGRTAFLFGLALACDLCDRNLDRMRGLDTLALRLGPKRTLRTIDIALLASAVCVLTNLVLDRYSGTASAALLASLTATAFGVRIVTRNIRGVLLQKASLDGMMVAQFVLVWVQFIGTQFASTHV